MPRHLGVGIHRIRQARLRGGRLLRLRIFFGLRSFFCEAQLAHFDARHYDVVHVHNMPNFLLFCAIFQKLADLMPEVYQSRYKLGRQHWLTWLLRVEELLSIRFPLRSSPPIIFLQTCF